MGGYGSSRWASEATKYTVEECLSLRIKDLVKEDILKPNWRTFRYVTWSNSFTNKVTSSLSYEIDTTKGNVPYCFIRLYYTMTQTQENIDYKILLTTTQPNVGGLRWWFQCPLVVNNRSCMRKVSGIYRTPNGRYFGCRHCLSLTYRSCQESDKRVNRLRNNPIAFESLLSRISSQENINYKDLFLALKVMR